MTKLRVAIAGIGNCASSLVQGVEFYADFPAKSDPKIQRTITPSIDGLGPGDLEFVAAFDIDRRKVGCTLYDAIFAEPNCALKFAEPPDHCRNVLVDMSPVLDGVAPHMAQYPDEASFRVSDAMPCNVAERLVNTSTEVLVIYLPVGSTQAARHFAKAALEAGVAVVNCVPVFMANDAGLSAQFADKSLPLVGDDIRSQVGATIIHQRLVELMVERGCRLRSTYQLNVGGNTDFLNMLDVNRLRDKKRSKSDAVMRYAITDLNPNNTHIGPSDYVRSQGDQKIAFIRVDAEGFGGVPLALDVRLSVEDSPNSAGVVMDVVRYAGAALRRGMGGILRPVSSYYMKSPPEPIDDRAARRRLEKFEWI